MYWERNGHPGRTARLIGIASAVTETVTTTIVQSDVENTVVSESTTTTAFTETSLFTTTTTATATETTVITAITTDLTTTTALSPGPSTVTVTSFDYGGAFSKRGIAARATSTGHALPDYAATACDSRDAYTSACAQIGVLPSTTTVTETVTETATVSESTTTTFSTSISTQTDIVSATTSISSTVTNIETITTTASTTTTGTASETITTTQITTPTSTVSITCEARGRNFRVRSAFFDGTTRFMNAINERIVAWQTFSPGTTNLGSSTWAVSDDGFLRRPAYGAAAELLAYVSETATGATRQVSVASRATVDTLAAAGVYRRVPACVESGTGQLVLLGGGGRNKLLECGNALYLSSGDGKDIRPDCHLLTTVVINQ